MTDKQPEALRLADEFDTTKSYLGSKAAAELRRLHEAREECERQYQEKVEEIIRLHEVNAELVGAVKAALSDDQPYIEKCKAALAKATGENND